MPGCGRFHTPSCASGVKNWKSGRTILLGNLASQSTPSGARVKAAALIVAVAAVDQALKLLVTHFIPLRASVPVIPGLLALTHVHNTGIAFSLRTDVSPIIPALITLAVMVFVFSNRTPWALTGTGRVALALTGGGALGNLIDRVRVGAVIDYLDLQVWPVFNLADAAVTLGAALFVLALVRSSG